jgi:hypothetical protein
MRRKESKHVTIPGQRQLNVDSLVTPVYVDTNALLDLLASLDDGFSFVEKVTSQSGQSRETTQSLRGGAGTEFGIPNVLSLLKINLGGSVDSRRGNNTGEQREAERYHTYGSLLYRLRQALISSGLVKRFDGTQASWTRIGVMDFVELQGTFRPNPFTESIRAIDRMAALFELYAGIQTKLTSSGTATLQGRHRQTNQPNAEEKAQIEQVKALRTLLKGLLVLQRQLAEKCP